MIFHRMGAAPADLPQKRDARVDHGDHAPMSQQDTVGSHGHEMYPQKFVRLVGCHSSGKLEVDVSSALVLAAEPTICGARAALTEPDYKILERYRDANNNSLPGTATSHQSRPNDLAIADLKCRKLIIADEIIHNRRLVERFGKLTGSAH